MDYNLVTIIIAFTLDLIVGDPQWKWHPVRIIGRLIEKLERKLYKNTINKKISGVILLILVLGITVVSVWVTLILVHLIHPIFYYIVSTLLIYFTLSIKSLSYEVNKVYRALKNNDMVKARKSLSMVVARDTEQLDQTQTIRAAVETVAESITDGVIAPLFYIFLGGPVLAWAYKSINTLDSMVGYRNEEYIDFGKASAALDRLLNFIPAKITCILIAISSIFSRQKWYKANYWTLKYFFKGPRENSEAVEAVMAASLGVQLGGLNFYNSVPIQKTVIGDYIYSLDIKHIKESIKISYISSLLMLISGIFLISILGRR